MKQTLAPALDVYADVILNPAFPAADFDRLRKQQLAAIQREQSAPLQIALRVFPRLLYGAGHAYGQPLTGSGTTTSVSALTREDLVKFHSAWFKPNNAKLIVVGDITLNELKTALEPRFAAWQKGTVPSKNIGTVSHAAKPAVYLIDRPGSPQTVIFAGHVAPPKGNPNEVAIETMNNVLGGQFTARINMNLREDKHWS